MLSRGKILVTIAVCSAYIGYQLLIHNAATSNQITSATASLFLIPFVVVVCLAIAAELGLPVAIFATAALALAGLSAVSVFGLPPPAIILGLPHLATNAFLLWLFARTLVNGRVPLVTTIAQRVNQTLPEEKVIYTRRVTFAWSLFFSLQIAVSLMLYAFSTLEAWSTYISFLNAPMIIAMFLIEYAFRMMLFRDHRSSPLAGIQAFFHNTPAAKSTKAP